ncbi:MAG: hypothetical protein WC348_03590 [Patescibacteria group bacterium]|jgi:thiamine kinase-like enzyme
MAEKIITEQAPDRNAELIKLFEGHGYKDVRPAENKNFNDIFYATKDGRECFIKKYLSHTGSNEITSRRAASEFACYENLPKDLLIDVLEINRSEKYLVLKRVEFEEVEKNRQYVGDFTDLGLIRFPEMDASFLPEITWEYYEGLFEKLKKLEEAGIIDNADAVIQLFKNKKDLIISAKKIFSHHDFNRLNIKKVSGKLKVFDFELSRRDNAMVDMATLYIDIRDDKDLVKIFEERLSQSELYNEELLTLMVIRRAAVVMNASMDKIKKGDKSTFLKDNLESFREAAEKLKTNSSR